MTTTDADVIEQSMFEPDLFGTIFDRHFDAIFRFCARRVGVAPGEDLAGDVFLWAFENREHFDRAHENARPWLFGIAHNFAQHALRSSGRQHFAYARWVIQEPRGNDGLAAQVAASVDAESDLCAVAAVLELQPVEEVETLLLFAWEHLSYAEIAEALAIPIGTVRSRINRVRQRLHDVLDLTFVRSDCPKSFMGGSA